MQAWISRQRRLRRNGAFSRFHDRGDQNTAPDVLRCTVQVTDVARKRRFAFAARTFHSARWSERQLLFGCIATCLGGARKAARPRGRYPVSGPPIQAYPIISLREPRFERPRDI